MLSRRQSPSFVTYPIRRLVDDNDALVTARPARHQTVILHFCGICKVCQMPAQAEPQDRILDAAMRVFRRHGFRRSSIEQAAEEAGLTRQALYHHFSSKEALFRAVITRLYESALAAEVAAAEAEV